MKRLILTTTLLLSLCATTQSQTTHPADVRTFDLTALGPPTPAMKYQLLFNDLADRLPGNAAILYLDSILLMGPDAKENAQKAVKAFDARDMKTFDSLADSLDRPVLFEELDLAGRREQCDWQSPFREMGVRTVLPHLAPLMHGVARLVMVRALRQMEQGKPDDALSTLRLGYELSDKIGREQTLISGLVSLNITTAMNDCLARLMNRPDSPNLYWALAEFPSRAIVLRTGFDGERNWVTASLAGLARAKAGEDLSAEQWRTVLDYIGGLPGDESGPRKRLDAVAGTSPQLLGQARQQYVQAHHLTAEQASKLDPAVVLGSFYFRQYQIALDDMYKLSPLPYPVLLARSRDYGARVASLTAEQPANPFLQMLPAIERAIWKFARADRELAALTAVEAIRSHAASHAGKLPQRLDEIIETPAPQNPATAKPFDYRLENNVATLSDSQSPDPLTYTIRIRK